MNSSEIENILKKEILTLKGFENFHGITSNNINDFIVAPYEAKVDPDDLETQERNMWVVLNVSKEFKVAYDSLLENWVVIEPKSESDFVAVVHGDSLGEALDGM